MHNLAVIRNHGVLNLSILTQVFPRCNPGVSRVATLDATVREIPNWAILCDAFLLERREHAPFKPRSPLPRKVALKSGCSVQHIAHLFGVVFPIGAEPQNTTCSKHLMGNAGKVFTDEPALVVAGFLPRVRKEYPHFRNRPCGQVLLKQFRRVHLSELQVREPRVLCPNDGARKPRTKHFDRQKVGFGVLCCRVQNLVPLAGPDLYDELRFSSENLSGGSGYSIGDARCGGAMLNVEHEIVP